MKTPLKKAKCFTLKSGNNPSGFKMMGSSPIYKKDEKEKGQVEVPVGGEPKEKTNYLKKAGNTLVAALTGGLDAVYGSGRIMPGTSKKITFAKDDKNAEKNVKTPGEKIINGEDDDKDKNKNKEV
tara:strand:- start:1620 stop:1994 length:375 start_codon:yes stop_codon:yes gene_type:complete